MADDIINHADFWLPPGFLSDEDETLSWLPSGFLSDEDETLSFNSVSAAASRVPFGYRSPEMEIQVGNRVFAGLPSYFSGVYSSLKSPPMLSNSPQSKLPGFGNLKSGDGSSNPTSPPTSDYWNFIYVLPSPPTTTNYSLACLCSSSPWRRPIKIMFHNRAREIVIGPSLTQQQRPNPPLQRGNSCMERVLRGSEMRRGCAGTGVFLPRQYGNLLPDSSQKKPGTNLTIYPTSSPNACFSLNSS